MKRYLNIIIKILIIVFISSAIIYLLNKTYIYKHIKYKQEECLKSGNSYYLTNKNLNDKLNFISSYFNPNSENCFIKFTEVYKSLNGFTINIDIYNPESNDLFGEFVSNININENNKNDYSGIIDREITKDNPLGYVTFKSFEDINFYIDKNFMSN